MDTSPAFERMQIARIRAFSAAKKFASVRSWTQSMTSAHLHLASPAFDERQRRDQAKAFVAREYGRPLAQLFSDAIHTRSAWRLESPDIQEALLPLLECAEQLKVPALLTGSVAGSIYGFPRSAQDVDIVADFQSQDLTFLSHQLAGHFLFDPPLSTVSQQQHTSFRALHLSRLITIDVFLPSTTFERALLERGQAHVLIEGRAPLLMVSAEDLILLHLQHYQAQGSRADDLWNDILGMLKVQAPILDVASLEQQAQGVGVSELFSQALIDAGIRDEGPLPLTQKG